MYCKTIFSRLKNCQKLKDTKHNAPGCPKTQYSNNVLECNYLFCKYDFRNLYYIAYEFKLFILINKYQVNKINN